METVGYRLVEPIGAGAFGVVWEARDRADRPVALKFLDCRAGHRDLINAEIRVLQALSEVRHPHIIRLKGVHAYSRHLVLVMEKADGNLADLRAANLEQQGRNLPVEQMLDIMEQAADTLDFLAGLKLPGLPASGMQHCDIKPSNLLVIGSCLKVADFGLCTGMGWHTLNGKGWGGTWPYAAPELYRGRPALGTDQYALAVTFCQMVMGDRVFRRGARPDDPPGVLPVDLTKFSEQREVLVLARALHAQAGYRYPSCAAFVAALRKANTPPRPSRTNLGTLPRSPCPV